MMCSFQSLYMFNFATWESIYSLFPSSILRCDYTGVLSVSTVTEVKTCLGELGSERIVGDQWTYRVLFSKTPAEQDHDVGRCRFRLDEGGVKFIWPVDSFKIWN